MKNVSPIRCGLAIACLLVSGESFAQLSPQKPSAAVSALPAAQPTNSAVPVGTTTVPEAASHQVDVEYSDGKLAVQATNASLNEVLREVAQKTGMKITGGVADDRVFGSYGPSKPAAVLDALLEGTGSNMLLVDDAQGKSELILTPRRGGATPPSPDGDRGNEAADDGAYVAPARPFQPPVASGRGPVPAGSEQSAPQEQEESNQPRTAAQIYEQLQKTLQLRQASAPPQ